MEMMKQAQVIYYLGRGGALEHPHLIDVAYSEEKGLLLKDVKRRLVAIRGKGLPESFSWSYKTTYRNDFIWHDVSDNDVILPMSDAEYILKGSEIVQGDVAHQCSGECDAEIQCKSMLKEHCCLTKSPLHRLGFEALAEECVIQTTNHPGEVKVYKKTMSPDNGTTTDSCMQMLQRPVSPFQQCRSEKPLPCVHRKEIPPRTSFGAEKTPPRRSITASVFGDIVSKAEVPPPAVVDSARTKKTGGSSLIFRQMLPCADIGTKAQRNGLFHGQKQIFAGRETGASWKQNSSKALKKGGKLVSLSADNGTNLSDGRHSNDIKPSLAFVRGNSTPVNKFQDEQQQRYSTLARYPRPRHSYSNSDYFEGSYDAYWRAEKVKEMDNELALPRQSNASRVSVESLYEVDCKARSTFDTGKEGSLFGKMYENQIQEESPRASVSSQIISKLLLDAKANEERNNSAARPAWWEEVRTPRREVDHERLQKSKLDWEKNLQDAVDMIIRPNQDPQRKMANC